MVPWLHPDVRRSARRLGCVLSVAALAACGGDGDDLDDEGAQPAPPVSTFEQGQFDDLPLPTDAEPVGPRSEQDGIVTRSYEVQGMVPRDVIDFYEQTLEEQGWSAVEIEEMREGYRGDWTTEEWNLRVSANEARGLAEDSGEPTTQISLVLSPLSATTVPGGATDG